MLLGGWRSVLVHETQLLPLRGLQSDRLQKCLGEDVEGTHVAILLHLGSEKLYSLKRNLSNSTFAKYCPWNETPPQPHVIPPVIL